MSAVPGSLTDASRQPLCGSIWLIIAVATGAHAFVASCVALYSVFPSSYDEIAHISFVQALLDAPRLFPDYGSYLLLDPHDLGRWTKEPNYLAHPSLYYLALSPLAALFPGNFLVLRFANVILSSLAMAFTAVAGVRLIDDRRTQTLFIIFLFCFPKNPVIGGIVSNDNLVLVATGLFLWGCASSRHRTAWLMAALVLAGWTKLTALVALAAAAGWLQIAEIAAKRTSLFGRASLLLGVAVLVGLLPYLVNFLRTGDLLFVPLNDFWIIPPERRLHLDFFGFVHAFFIQLAAKFPAADRMLRYSWPLLGLLGLSLFALRGAGKPRVLAIGFLGALAVFTAVHLGYAWHTFNTAGELADAQIRYYNVLWPGFAFAIAVACSSIDGRRWPVVSVLAIILCLLPTALGLIVLDSPAA